MLSNGEKGVYNYGKNSVNNRIIPGETDPSGISYAAPAPETKSTSIALKNIFIIYIFIIYIYIYVILK